MHLDQVDSDTYFETRYTIRRLGCSAWTTGVRADRLADELRHANDVVPGHVVIGESGPLEGELVDPAAVAAAVAEVQS